MTLPTPPAPQYDRRTHSLESKIIADALQVAKRSGIGSAIDFMLERSIPACLAYRVLTDPLYQRSSGDRRAHLRCPPECEPCGQPEDGL